MVLDTDSAHLHACLHTYVLLMLTLIGHKDKDLCKSLSDWSPNREKASLSIELLQNNACKYKLCFQS